ncbi:hypothetical protein GXW78_20655 [Roseomonas terrae]|uniref:Uncharacterized protein n=1 Tax=Neoroseomonas terrae TaxID=424799 RepID=A0ABS5EM24_9PROT|nr:hypothetical protein [Neoroseomonas terrae]MBR0652080.1 hypothetical protein [Neoroseomonas terrae]
MGALALCIAAPAAQAQGRVEVAVTGRTDTGGATPTCLLTFRLTNGGPNRIGTFAGEFAAVDAGGAALPTDSPTVPFLGVPPGASSEWSSGAVRNARCDQVRLRIVQVVCTGRCAPVAWTQEGLAGLEPPRTRR